MSNSTREVRLGGPSQSPPGLPRYNGELVALRRRIAELEEERGASNVAINDLLARASALERRLADSLAALADERARFTAHVDAEIAAIEGENARLTQHIGLLQASRFWQCARLLRGLRARLTRVRRAGPQ